MSFIKSHEDRVLIGSGQALEYHENQSDYMLDGGAASLPKPWSFKAGPHGHKPWTGYMYHSDFQGQGPALELYNSHYKEIRLGAVPALQNSISQLASLKTQRDIRNLPPPDDPLPTE